MNPVPAVLGENLPEILHLKVLGNVPFENGFPLQRPKLSTGGDSGFGSNKHVEAVVATAVTAAACGGSGGGGCDDGLQLQLTGETELRKRL